MTEGLLRRRSVHRLDLNAREEDNLRDLRELADKATADEELKRALAALKLPSSQIGCVASSTVDVGRASHQPVIGTSRASDTPSLVLIFGSRCALHQDRSPRIEVPRPLDTKPRSDVELSAPSPLAA